MKLKLPLIIISLIAIIGILIFLNVPAGNDFTDIGTSFDNNDDWINHNMNITRNNKFTILSGESNASLWYIANYTINNDFIVEWDNHGKPNNCDYCLISSKDLSDDTPLNLVNDLNISKDCHVKLVINESSITTYVDGDKIKTVPLKGDLNKGMVFRFQINPNGSDINYSNFKIQKAIK